MEGGRDSDDGGVAGAAAAGQERRWWRGAGCGDEEESSHGSSGGVELSLRLRTGAADDDDGAASAPPPLPLPLPPAEARRNMTIFYNGRVCAVDVTEVQARAIISMASEETLAADHRRRQQLMRGDGDDGRSRQQDGDGNSSSIRSAAVARRCARDRGLVRPAAVALTPSPLGVVGSPRQGGFAGGAVAAPVLEIDPAAPTGLSMKRSLQLFLQKRKARTAAAVAPPYAAGGRQAQAVRR
ncbi:protein TIFY 5-like [Miscanthus floridulus]|uniref:protein TIFY 5-like n=1 Tax=Miscanthus floridulus TaxID=154761 RepID=UPI00345A06BD